MKAANQQLESKYKGGPQIWCERLQCNISIGGCRARHEKAINPHRRSIGGFWNAVPHDIGCAKCQQAEQIRQGKWEGMIVDMSAKVEEQKERESVKNVIIEAEKKFKQSAPKTKQCRVCKRQLPLDQFTKNSSEQDGLDPLCRDCKHERQKKYRDRIKEQRKGLGLKGVQTYKEIEEVTRNTKITLDFTEHGDLFDNIVKMAKSEFRSPDQQIMYFLATQLMMGRDAK